MHRQQRSRTARHTTAARLTGMLALATTALFTANTAWTTGGPNDPRRLEALSAGEPITVYAARKIYTMDPDRPEARAIAVLDGKVLSTGTLDSMQPWLSRYEYTVDEILADRIIMPGF